MNLTWGNTVKYFNCFLFLLTNCKNKNKTQSSNFQLTHHLLFNSTNKNANFDKETLINYPFPSHGSFLPFCFFSILLENKYDKDKSNILRVENRIKTSKQEPKCQSLKKILKCNM